MGISKVFSEVFREFAGIEANYTAKRRFRTARKPANSGFFQKKGQLIGLRHCLAGAGVLFAPVSVPIPCKQEFYREFAILDAGTRLRPVPFCGLKGENRRIPCASNRELISNYRQL
jgi:hypothetical protein